MHTESFGVHGSETTYRGQNNETLYLQSTTAKLTTNYKTRGSQRHNVIAILLSR